MSDSSQEEPEINNGDDTDKEIAEEQVIEQQIVPFLGDDLTAALTPSGVIYISLPGICKALGLLTRGQVRRIRETKSLAKGLRRISLTTRGGSQSINCLRVDKVALWLAGVQTNMMKDDRFRLKIETYQEELAPVATQVFMRVMGIRTAQIIPTEDPRIITLAEEIDDLTEVTIFLREQMETMLKSQGHVSMQLEQAVRLLESLVERQDTTEVQVAHIDERTKRLTSAHARDVQVLVDQVAKAIEKRSPDISSHLAHARVHGRLKTRFQVRTYIEIPDERFDEAMTYLRNELRKFTGGKMPEQGGLF